MKQILTLSVTALKEKIYVAFMLIVLNIIDEFEVLNEKLGFYFDQFRAAYHHLNFVYMRNDLKYYTKKVLEADEARVKAFRELRDIIRINLTYPKTEKKGEAANILMSIIQLYGCAEISRLKISEKTAALPNLIEDYEEKYNTEVQTLGLQDLLEDLKEKQTEFMRIYLIRNDMESEFDLNAMADARKQMTDAYRDLVTAVNLGAKRDEEGELTDFINRINVEIRKNFVNSGQSGSSASDTVDGEVTIPVKNLTFNFANGNQQKFKIEVGAPIEVPANTFGYIWNKEIPEFMPNKNLVFKEIPITSKEAVAMFHFFDHREEEIRQLVGSVLNAPANTPGYVWEPAVPATMPDGDTSYYEMPVADNQEPTLVTMLYLYHDNSEDTRRGEPGTPLSSPEPDAGYEWDPTPPNVFPDHDMTFTEVEIDGGEGDGDDDAGFGR